MLTKARPLLPHQTPRSTRRKFREWYGVCRALRNDACPTELAVFTHSGLGLVFRHGMLCSEWNGIRRVGYQPTSFVLGLVTLDEARRAGKAYRRCAIGSSRHYRIHGTTRDCPIPLVPSV